MLTKVLITTTLHIALVLFVGFLKFLKREKKQDFDDLDLPPPPPMEEFENLPEPPELPEFEKISAPETEDFKLDMPEEPMPEQLQESMPWLEDLDKDLGMDNKDLDKDIDFGKDFEEMAMPEMEPEPLQPSMQSTQPQSAPNIEAAQTIEMPVEEHLEERPTYPRKLFAKPRRRPTAGSVYVRVEDFKAMLGAINIIRNDLRKSDEALMKLEGIKNSKDRSFDRIKSHLDDLQKKLIFVDKTLFEEE